MKKIVTAGAVSVYALFTGMSAMAADTEIFYMDPPENQGKPNLLFIMSTGGTMNGGVTPPEGCADSSKIGALKCILTDIIDTEDRVNVGLMRFSKPGGPVLYPIVDLSGSYASTVPVTTYIDDNNNDLVQTVSDSSITTNGTSIELGSTGNVAAFRFENVHIPKGATITNASIRFSIGTTGTNQSTPGTFDVYVENSANATQFDISGTEVYDPATTTRTLFTPVIWNVDTWTVDENTQNAAKSTPNLDTELNTIVNLGTWCGGNSINVYITPSSGTGGGTRTVRTSETLIDGFSAGEFAPNLYIEWDDSSIGAGDGCFQNRVGATLSSNADDQEDTPIVYKNNGSYKSGGITADVNDLDFAVQDLSGNHDDITAVGLLFKNLNIPQGSTISEAYFTLVVDDADGVNFSTDIGAVQNPAFTEWTNGFTATAVGATVNWSQSSDTDGDGAADGAWTSGQTVRSPDISSVIQQLVNSGSWINDGTNNNVPLKLVSSTTTERRAKSADSGHPARLFVSYTGNYAPGVSTNVRDAVKAAVNDYKLVSNQPTTETYLEGYEYYTGGLVNFGGYRGSPTRTTNRVSHPESYQYGVVDYGSAANESTCLANYPEDNNCKGETIVKAGGSSDPDPTYIKPPMGVCTTNNIVLLSDGAPSPMSEGDYVASRVNTITGETCSDNDGEDCSVYMSAYMANNDTNPDLDEDQLIITHAIHFGADNENKYRFGKAVAEESGGMFLIAEDGPALEEAFETLISSLAKVNTSFVSAGITVNQANRLTHRDQLYFSLFRPEPYAIWPGNVKRYRIFDSTIWDSNNISAIAGDEFIDDSQSWWSTEVDGNDAGKGGAASNLNFGTTARKTFSNLTGNTNITANSANMVSTSNNNPDWETLLGTADATQSTGVLAWIMGRNVDVSVSGVFSVATGYHNIIGDPLHSKPTLLTYKDGNTVYDRVFVGTNHGFIHALDTITGVEKWSFMPKELLSNVKDYVENAARLPEEHEYGVDGSISIYIDDKNGNGIVDLNDDAALTDKAYMFVGLRRGGNSYYAFDITDDTNPKLLYVIDNSVTGYSNLGQTWSKPTVMKILDSSQSSGYRLGLIFGGGYDTNQDPTDADPTGGAPNSSDTVGTNIYIADALTGALIWDAQTSTESKQAPGAGPITDMNSVPGDVLAIDYQRPGYLTHIYAADTLGQVFRFDINRDWNGLNAQTTLAQGGKLAHIQQTAEETDPVTYSSCLDVSCNRRFYYSPDVAFIPRPNGLSFMSVSLGSGYRAHPLGLENSDHFYTIRDMGILVNERNADGDLTGFKMFDNHDGSKVGDDDWEDGVDDEVIRLENLVPIRTELQDYTSDYTASEDDVRLDPALDLVESLADPKAGWFLALDTGEKVLAKSVTFNNRVIFTTYLPQNSDNLCAPVPGSGRVYAVSVVDGTPVVEVGERRHLHEDRYLELHNIGIPPEPQIILLPDPTLLIGRQTDEELNALLGSNFGEMLRVKWRERSKR